MTRAFLSTGSKGSVTQSERDASDRAPSDASARRREPRVGFRRPIRPLETYRNDEPEMGDGRPFNIIGRIFDGIDSNFCDLMHVVGIHTCPHKFYSSTSKSASIPPCELCLWLDLGPKPILESFHFESRSASNSP